MLHADHAKFRGNFDVNWPMFTIDQIKDKSPRSCVGGPFGSDLTTRDYTEDGVPVIRGNNLSTDGYFHDSEFVFVSVEKASSLSANAAFPGDLVFTQRGTLGQVALIPEQSIHRKYVISQSQMKLTVNREIVLPEFVYWWFRQPNVIEMVRRRAITSGVPHINLGILKSFELKIPSLEVQNKIVKTVRELSALVENNRRRIFLLEESARLLYREWFVHLRFPGHEHVKVVDGVPKGWGSVPLVALAKLNYGKALKEEHRIPGNYPVYGSSGVVGSHQSSISAGPGIIVGRKGNVGAVYWSSSGFFAIDTAYFVAADESNLHLYYALRNAKFMSTDVAVPGLNRDFAHSIKILVPSDELKKEFIDIAASQHEQIESLNRYNKKLSEARDLLLPRLMSGEIQV